MILLDKSTKKILLRNAVAKFFLIIPVCISFFVTSCKESNVVGLDVQPANDLLNVTYQDTATLFTRTVKMDSLRTDETFLQSATTDVLLGTYLDPVFGKTSASIYTQLMLSTENPGFETNPILDSAVLSLVYDPSYYGKAQHAAQNINVFEVLEDIKDTSYYSNESLSVSSVSLANYMFVPNLTKSDTIFGEAMKPQLRIRLANFGQNILDNQGTANLISNDAFQSYFKGLYITTENTTGLSSGDGNILRFKLADSQTRLTLYYHNDTEGDSLKYYFSLAGAAHFSNFTHDFSAVDANLASQLSSLPPIQNDVVFIQAMSGTKVKIEMPYIMNWNKLGPIGINKAELVIKINTNAAYELETFAAPERLKVYGINDDGSDYFLPDDLYENANHPFGGYYNPDTKEYRINISRYIQQILNGKIKNNGLHLLAFNGAINANRVVVGGGGNGSLYQMKLNITSTKVP